MPAVALALALAAAVVHASWNVLLARAPRTETATAVALVTAQVVFAPVAVATWRVHAAVWPFVVASAALETVYFWLLASAYRREPVSVVYPVARGGAPVLVLALAALAGTAPSAGQGGAVALVLAGVLLVGGVRRAGRGALAFGVGIAACIAGYTLVDKHGVRHAGPIPYLELVMLGPTLLYAGAVVRARGVAAVRAAVGPASIAAGVATFVAYALVLAALQRAPAASVAAVRETGVVIAALLAAVVLRERVGPLRLAGAVLVAGGVALLALS